VKPARVGCVPYLNARPLVDYLEHPSWQGKVTVVYATPTRLAAALRLGEVDVAMVSSYEAFVRPDLEFVPGMSISTKGRVMSVRLFSKVPFEDIETLALDEGSLTSSHLVQVLLSELYGCWPILSDEPPVQEHMLERNDACLLIGDPGMGAPSRGLNVLDLGEAWDDLTGLPFVWAGWIGPVGLDSELCHLLAESKHWGERRLESLAEKHAELMGWEVAKCVTYLSAIMNFDLTPKHGLLENQYPIRVATPCPKEQVL
jgi:chorismate dehydratase